MVTAIRLRARGRDGRVRSMHAVGVVLLRLSLCLDYTLLGCAEFSRFEFPHMLRVLCITLMRQHSMGDGGITEEGWNCTYMSKPPGRLLCARDASALEHPKKQLEAAQFECLYCLVV